jgi:UDP-N-acetyl-2-amino-2-deoxyglucuronate dehydrogenase
MSVRFGLIGAGLAGPLFGGALRERPRGAQLWAVATRHDDSARAFAERYGVPHRYTNWRELIADPEVDAVCIATPTGTHAEVAIAAARAGKHVLSEKPMAATLAEADTMIAACEANGVTLGVIFMYRFMDTALKMKEAIDSGRIGTPILGECIGRFLRSQEYYDSGDWRGTWKGEGGGSLMSQTSHTLDLLIWMLGDVEQLAGFYTTTQTHEIETDDLAVASLKFRGGALGSIISSTAIRPPSDRVLTIHGERGTVGLVGDRLARWHVDGEPDREAEAMLRATIPDRGDTAAKAGYADSELHRRQIEDFVAAIEGGRRPKVDAAEGRRTLEVMRALYLSSDRGSVVTFPVREEVLVS